MTTDTNVETVFENVADMPDDLKAQLSKSFINGSVGSAQLIEKLRPILDVPKSMDDIIIGWWHLYDHEVLKRSTTTTKISNLAKAGLLIKHGHGVYGLPPEDGKAKK